MKCSRSEFLNVISTWRESVCAVHLHSPEINGAILVALISVSDECVEFSSHRLVERLTIDLSQADEFEFVIPEREADADQADLVGRVSDEMVFARIAGKLLFSMTRLIDPYAERLASR